MSRTARLWKGVGPLTLGGILLSGGIAAQAAQPDTLSKQLADLGRQAASQGKTDDARTFYKNALKLDPKNEEVQRALSKLSNVRRVSYQDPVTPPPPGDPVTPGTPEPSALERQAQIADVQRQAFVTDISQRLQTARNLTNSRNPDAALATLRDALTVVQSADNIPEASRKALENQVRTAIAATERLEERISLEKAEEYRVIAAQAARSSAVDRLVRSQETTATLMAEFDSLMAEGMYRVLASGGMADIDVTRQPFVDARFRAQAARAIDAYQPAPWAGMFVSDSIGFFTQGIQYDRLKEYRAMLTWSDVDRATVPFPDYRAIEYPERAAWQALSERRLNRYGDSDYLFDRDEKTKAILKKLGEPLSMNFATDTPLADVKKYIQDATQDEAAGLPTGIPIYVDPIGLQDADKTMADTVTIQLEGIPLKTTLRLLLKQLSLTYTVKDGLMTITSTASEDQPTEIRVYYAADLALIPLSLMGGGQGGGGMGGMGGGMGGMGGGMGGMGGGGMGGMGGGGMGGMGGMMSVPPQDPGTLPGGGSAGTFEEKKKQLNATNQSPPNANSGANNQGRVASPATGPGSVSKPVQKPSKDDAPVVKSVGPKAPAAGKGAGGLQPGVDPYKFWNDFFATAKFKTPAEAEGSLFQTVSDVIKAGRLDYAEAAIKAYLFYHSKDAQPWMYEMLVKCIESRKGQPGQPKEQNDANVRQAIGYAAHLAKKRKSSTDLIRIADMMVIRRYYGQIGDPGYQTNIGELVDLAAEKDPANAYPPMMSVNLAIHDKDPKRMADAADRLLSLGWPGYDDKLRRDVKEQAKQLSDALKVDGKGEEADSLMANLADSEARDVFIRLTWKGEADIDMSVAEPLGATANFKNPRTVFGGAIIKNGYGNHPEEVYVCPRGFDGSYTIAVEKIVDYDEKNPVLEATLEVILHEGTADERREPYKIDLTKPQPIVVKLTGGRRKTVLPFVAPPQAPPVVTGPKPKDATKKANAPVNPPGPPIR